MRKNPRDPSSVKSFKRGGGFHLPTEQAILDADNHPHQQYLFGEPSESPVSRFGARATAGGVPCEQKDLERYAKILVAKYLSVGLGQPLVIIAELMGASEGTISRWVHTNLPVTVDAARRSCNAQQVEHLTGFRVIKTRAT